MSELTRGSRAVGRRAADLRSLDEPRSVRPARLRPGDTVAVLSPSWGGPAAFPHVFEAGLDVLRSWGLVVREYATTRAAPAELAADPVGRARDLTSAFADPLVRAVFASIGGDDAVRLLPHLDPLALAANPTLVVGYSDTTVLLAAARRAGIVACHGPSVMAGIGQLPSLGAPAMDHVRAMLFDAAGSCEYPAFPDLSEGYPDWRTPRSAGVAGEPRPAGAWRILQGDAGPFSGRLEGGCLEVLDWLRGTWVWLPQAAWDGAILVLETSEEAPPALAVTRMMRSLGVAGVLDRVAGILLGRWRGRTPEEAAEVEAAIVAVVAAEFGRPALPIVANLPFGHTDPQWVLPLGTRATVEPALQRMTLDEPWLS